MAAALGKESVGQCRGQGCSDSCPVEEGERAEQDAARLVERGAVQELRAPAPAGAEEIEAEAVGLLLRFRVARRAGKRSASRRLVATCLRGLRGLIQQRRPATPAVVTTDRRVRFRYRQLSER
jgi:hypothetical protein